MPLVAGALLLVAAPAAAQQEVQVAATAFAEGQQAQLRGDYDRAAELFEIADHSVPSAAALRSAIRMRGAAGDDVRAATLALQALQRYPDDTETRGVAESTLDRLAPRLSRIRLHCNEPCTATLDGALVGAGPLVSIEFFVTPGTHVIRGSWPERRPVSESLQAQPGQALEVELTAPARREPPASVSAAAAAPVVMPQAPNTPPPSSVRLDSQVSSDARRSSDGLSPAVFWVGTGLTAVGGALIWWSGQDTLDERDAYERNPTRAGYDHGVRLERRTNLLIAATSVVGAATLGVGLFATDWGGRSELGVSLGPAHAAISMTGALP